MIQDLANKTKTRRDETKQVQGWYDAQFCTRQVHSWACQYEHESKCETVNFKFCLVLCGLLRCLATRVNQLMCVTDQKAGGRVRVTPP